ncbi:hypothetical protein [Streptomyces sp. NPDC001678]|uniref:hypothetical protein n=1 Tax=Streptomyces sp. NPDC001678 TaxID=3364599 RepID=UPI00368AFDA9
MNRTKTIGTMHRGKKAFVAFGLTAAAAVLGSVPAVADDHAGVSTFSSGVISAHAQQYGSASIGADDHALGDRVMGGADDHAGGAEA